MVMEPDHRYYRSSLLLDVLMQLSDTSLLIRSVRCFVWKVLNFIEALVIGFGVCCVNNKPNTFRANFSDTCY